MEVSGHPELNGLHPAAARDLYKQGTPEGGSLKICFSEPEGLAAADEKCNCFNATNACSVFFKL